MNIWAVAYIGAFVGFWAGWFCRCLVQREHRYQLTDELASAADASLGICDICGRTMADCRAARDQWLEKQRTAVAAARASPVSPPVR